MTIYWLGIGYAATDEQLAYGYQVEGSPLQARDDAIATALGARLVSATFYRGQRDLRFAFPAAAARAAALARFRRSAAAAGCTIWPHRTDGVMVDGRVQPVAVFSR